MSIMSDDFRCAVMRLKISDEAKGKILMIAEAICKDNSPNPQRATWGNKVPESVRKTLNGFKNSFASETFNIRSWVTDLVEAIYSDPPTRIIEKTPIKSEAGSVLDERYLQNLKQALLEPLVPGAWYELEGRSMHAGGIFQCKENERVYSQRPGKFIIGNSMFSEDGGCIDGIPGFTCQPILRRVWLTEKEPEAAQVDPIDAVLKALDDRHTLLGLGGVIVEGRGSVMLYKDQI